MIELVPAVFVSSLAGSVHCVAMCGPLVALHGGAGSLRLAAIHALGRLAAYAGLGAAAGLIGRAVDLAGSLADVQRAAAIAAAAVVIAWGVRALVAARRPAGDGTASGTAFRRGLVQIRRRRRPAVRAWLAGALTGLLPCGWLWAFVVAAAGTGGPAAGALVMAAFWLGTVPAMTGALTVAAPLLATLRRRLPAVTAVVLVAVGLATLGARWRDAGAAGAVHPSCHEVRP